MSKKKTLKKCFIYGGGRWIRTIEITDNRFTVCPLWPLGNSSIFCWCWQQESNSRPTDYKSVALPAELCQLIILYFVFNGGHNRDRTCDPLLVRQVLSQLSYAPLFMVEEDGFEPSKSLITDLQSAPFGHSGIPPYFIGAGSKNRTRDLLITSQLLYLLSYASLLRFIVFVVS